MQERNWARGTVHRDKEKKLSASPPPWSIEAINTTVGYIDQEHLSHLPFEGWSNAPDLLWTPMLSHKCRLHVKLQWLWQKITGEHEDWKLGECIVSLVNNASSRGGKNKRGKMNITHPLTDRQRDKWKNKEAIVCLTGPALHHIGFYENTRLRERTGGNLKEQSNTSCWLLQPGVLHVTQTQSC